MSRGYDSKGRLPHSVKTYNTCKHELKVLEHEINAVKDPIISTTIIQIQASSTDAEECVGEFYGQVQSEILQHANKMCYL